MLGSGLGSLADEVEDPVAIPFERAAGLARRHRAGHVGRLLLGTLCAASRSPRSRAASTCTRATTRASSSSRCCCSAASAPTLVILTNAAGGVNPAYGPGTLMVISDHLNLTGRTPLLGPNADELGPRFPDLTDVWAPRLRSRLHDAARAEGVELEEGIYAGLIGPAYETPAEVRMLHALGARCGRHVDGARGDRGALGRASRCAG